MHRAILKAMVAAWPFLVPPASPPETVDRHMMIARLRRLTERGAVARSEVIGCQPYFDRRYPRNFTAEHQAVRAMTTDGDSGQSKTVQSYGPGLLTEPAAPTRLGSSSARRPSSPVRA
jgi:hypothetical protein